MLNNSRDFATFYERHYISAQDDWVRCISEHLADCSRVFGGDLQAMTLEVLLRCWVVERTFNWMTRPRRLVRDDESRIDVSTAMIHVAMSGLPVQRNAHPCVSKRTLCELSTNCEPRPFVNHLPALPARFYGR